MACTIDAVVDDVLHHARRVQEGADPRVWRAQLRAFYAAGDAGRFQQAATHAFDEAVRLLQQGEDGTQVRERTTEVVAGTTPWG